MTESEFRTERLAKNQIRTQRLKFWMDAFIRALAILIAVTVGISLYYLVTLTQQNNELTQQNNRIGERLIDCTTQGHTCYDQSNARTNKVIITLNDVTKAAAVCADKPGSIKAEQMDDCIKAVLTKEGK